MLGGQGLEALSRGLLVNTTLQEIVLADNLIDQVFFIQRRTRLLDHSQIRLHPIRYSIILCVVNHGSAIPRTGARGHGWAGTVAGMFTGSHQRVDYSEFALQPHW